MQPKTVAMITAGVAVTAGIGYMIYFDHKRRNDPELKRKLKKEKKKVKKEIKKAEEATKSSALQLIEAIMAAAEKEKLPETPEEKEKYFMEMVSAGETLCAKGEAHYSQAVLPFYLALKVYPAPMELIMIYQKTVPEPVFQLVVSVMSLEQQKRQNKFYEQFPPKETNTKLKGFPTGTNEQGTPVVRYALAAGKSIKEGEVIYSETPLVASLFPELEGRFCNLCLKEIDAAEKVECPQCDVVAYCSKECLETATEEYHKHVCPQTKPKEGEEEATEDKTAVEFNELFKKNNTKYPIMIARFLSTMVAEEVKKAKETEKSEETTFGAWDHVDRFRYLETSPSEQTAAEIDMLKEALGPKVQGISEFLSNEIYLMLKGKLLYNAYAITTTKEDVVVEEAAEHMRTVDAEAKPIAAGLYKIATYLGQSQDEPNVKLSFQDNKLTVTALKDIDEDAELTADYTLPVPKKN